MMRVLFASHDNELVDSCRPCFATLGLTVLQVAAGAAAIDAASSDVRAIDMMVVDHRLPDMGGSELCSVLRLRAATQRIPLIMLGRQVSEIDTVVAFEVGADDYLHRPLQPRELALRLRALARRSGLIERERAEDTKCDWDGVVVDAEAHEVRVDGRVVALTLLEFRLLDTLQRRRGRLQSRQRLLEDVWCVENEVMHRTVDTHVKRLRAKLGDAGQDIETVRGLGYRFRV